jgi:hypothetical protein
MVVMVVMTMMVAAFSESRNRKQHDQGEEQSLFHAQIIATTETGERRPQ